MFATRLSKRLSSNPERVILQYFIPGGTKRIQNVIDRVMLLNESEVSQHLVKVIHDFSSRHLNFKHKLMENYNRIENYITARESLTRERKLLLGAYFSKEYSIEAAALFNPSIVPHPDQSYLKPGMVRFVLSLRATGEGHISSIEFRSGIIDENGEIYFDEASRFCELPIKDNKKRFDKRIIIKALRLDSEDDRKILNTLPEFFSRDDIKEIMSSSIYKESELTTGKFFDKVFKYVDSNYDIEFSESSSISERIMFPNSVNESNGMEDARFVKFTEDNGTNTYYATYTAYNGRSFGTQLIETKDFIKFNIHSLHGDAVQDKGMGLFPRKINGKYVITSRQGGENLQIMFSEDLFNWGKYEQLQIPIEPWEFVQLGNCGSPIETKYGWLLITHAVGYFRKYSIGAMLLDLENPSKVIGRLKMPLIEPIEDEREGYVPNVVYSCGSMLHNDELIIPYAMSDAYCGFAKASLTGLLLKLVEGK